MRLFSIVVILLSPLFWGSQDPERSTMANISQAPLHDIDSYEKAGPYNIIRHSDGTLQLEQIDKSRAWLWEHWNQHRLSLLMLTRYSVEGERTTYFYYIEPDHEGRWRMVVKTESLEYNHRYKDPDCRRFKERFFAVYSLARTEPGEEELKKQISISELRSPATYLLSFRAENGEEVAVF
jgi:hypothetical protein